MTASSPLACMARAWAVIAPLTVPTVTNHVVYLAGWKDTQVGTDDAPSSSTNVKTWTPE